MIIDRMVSTIQFDTSGMSKEDWDKLGERITKQIQDAIIEYCGEQIDIEDSKKKPKPYYRKGRWE